MKKAKSRKRGPVTKNARTEQNAPGKRNAPKKASAAKSFLPKTVDQYFAAIPEPARNALQQIRNTIRSVVPPEAIEIISYKIPAFKHKKVLVWYAAFANHCSLFPTAAVIEAFKDELSGFSTSKGTVHFPMDKPMPVELIKKVVKARMAQPESKTGR